MKAMVLAAGRGERFRPMTDTCPKPLIEVAGESLIERHLKRLAAVGFEDIVINLGWLGDRIVERLGDGQRYGVRIAYSEEGWPALETGGGIRHALPQLGTAPFAVINGDVWTDFPLGELKAIGDLMAPNDLAHMVLVPNPAHHPRGDCSLVGVARPARVMPACGETFTFSGLSVLKPELLADVEPGAFGLWPHLRDAAIRGQVSGECFSGLWSDVGTFERWGDLKQQLSLQNL